MVYLNQNPVLINNIFCVGRNYIKHIQELNNDIPIEPLLFLRPNSSLSFNENIYLPHFSQDIHFETELVVLIGQNANQLVLETALDVVAGYGIGLDLTARDVQNEAKKQGLPWTKAKGFKGAACVAANFIDKSKLNHHDISFSMRLNGELKQCGCTKNMIFSIPKLLCELADVYGLRKGDLVFTGTPEGVGKLVAGDVLELDLAGMVQTRFRVV